MPNIRVMCWNIQTFSTNKSRVGQALAGQPAAMATALAQVILNADVDIATIVELRGENPNHAMTALTRLSAALRALDPNNQRPYLPFMSHHTGTERYGFIVRDPAATSPLTHATGMAPNALFNLELGTSISPLRDLNQLAYTVNQAPQPMWNSGQDRCCFLLDLWSKTIRGWQAFFPGQVFSSRTDRIRGRSGGANLGYGYRLPCLAMFMVGQTLIPLVVCHHGAGTSRWSANATAASQIRLLRALHISQLFQENGSIRVVPAQGQQEAAFPVNNLIVTGDYNIDFLLNFNSNSNSRIPTTIRNCYRRLSTAQRQSGPVASVLQPAQNSPVANPPAVVTGTNWLREDEIADLSLTAATTHESTYLRLLLPLRGQNLIRDTLRRTSSFDAGFTDVTNRYLHSARFQQVKNRLLNTLNRLINDWGQIQPPAQPIIAGLNNLVAQVNQIVQGNLGTFNAQYPNIRTQLVAQLRTILFPQFRNEFGANHLEMMGIACYDNIFFGGASLNSNAPLQGRLLNPPQPPPNPRTDLTFVGQPPPVPANALPNHAPPVVAIFQQDRGSVVDVPQLIRSGVVATDALQQAYGGEHSHFAEFSPLQANPGNLDSLDAIIRARFLSDHLPVVVQFDNLP